MWISHCSVRCLKDDLLFMSDQCALSSFTEFIWLPLVDFNVTQFLLSNEQFYRNGRHCKVRTGSRHNITYVFLSNFFLNISTSAVPEWMKVSQKHQELFLCLTYSLTNYLIEMSLVHLYFFLWDHDIICTHLCLILSNCCTNCVHLYKYCSCFHSSQKLYLPTLGNMGITITSILPSI